MRTFRQAMAFLAICAAAGGAVAQQADAPAPERVCFSTTETRDNILTHKLADPFALLRAQAAEHRADAISVKLCQVGPTFIYEIDLLRRDGRLIHTRVDARSGQPAEAPAHR